MHKNKRHFMKLVKQNILRNTGFILELRLAETRREQGKVMLTEICTYNY